MPGPPPFDAGQLDSPGRGNPRDADDSRDAGASVPSDGGLGADAHVPKDGGNQLADSTPPRLVASSPNAGAVDIWVREPIRLRFSEALDPDSIPTGLELSAKSGTVDFEYQVDSEGDRLTVAITTPPRLPTRLTLAITPRLRDRSGNAAEPASIAWDLPLWYATPLETRAPGVTKLAHGGRAAQATTTAVAWEQPHDGATSIRVAQFAGREWQPLSPLDAAAGARLADLIIDADAQPTVTWSEGEDPRLVRVARLQATGWQRLDDALTAELSPEAKTTPQLAVDDTGAVVLAWQSDKGIELRRETPAGAWDTLASAWQPENTGEPIGALDLAWTASGPVLAIISGAPGAQHAHVHRFEDSWQPLGSMLDHDRNDNVMEITLPTHVPDNGPLHVAWTEQVNGAASLYTSRWSPEDSRWRRVGAALNVNRESDAGSPTLQLDGDGQPLVGWTEHLVDEWTSHVAHFRGSRWQALGGSIARPGHLSTLALGERDVPLIAVSDSDAGTVSLLRYNESPEPPFGLGNAEPPPCILPADRDPAFPGLLSETGCYSELSSQTVADGLIPYEINAPLWADGALKRRFLAVPEGSTIEFSPTDAWGLPIGTLLVKEFWLEHSAGDPTSRFIVETRLLVKRCQPGNCRAAWQGYSYRWNAAGDEAQLLDNDTETLFVAWPVQEGTHTHGYPGRSECTRCHALAAGGSLGLRTHQLNRNHRYPDTVDNQLRALSHAGLFGDTFTPDDLGKQARLPTPSDPAFEIEERVRGYFDANCSHCHRPSARWPVIDFRYEAPLVADDGSGMVGNICDMIVPGDASASLLYQKDLARPDNLPEGFTGDPMPPLGTLLPDTRQLAIIKRWIDAMTSCP